MLEKFLQKYWSMIVFVIGFAMTFAVLNSRVETLEKAVAANSIDVRQVDVLVFKVDNVDNKLEEVQDTVEKLHDKQDEMLNILLNR